MKNKIETVDLICLIESFQKNSDFKLEIKRNFFYFSPEKHYAINCDGYYVGWEEFIGKLRIYNKKEFNEFGKLPYSLFPYCVIPKSFSIHKIIPAPATQKEGYFKPTKDAIYEELGQYLNAAVARMEEPTFNMKERTWNTNYFKYKFSLDLAENHSLQDIINLYNI